MYLTKPTFLSMPSACRAEAMRRRMSSSEPCERVRDIRRSSGFTLLELLVVISIIAILAGMVIPMFYSAKERAKEAKARVEVKQLEAAFKAYLDTYKVWPASWPQGTIAPIDGVMVFTLRGDDMPTENPQKIAFYEFPIATNLPNDTTAWDPWSDPADPAKCRAYYGAIDNDYDNKIQVGENEVKRSAVVWSIGKNRVQEFGLGDDLASWR